MNAGAACTRAGLWIRITVEESPLFRELEDKGETEKAPMAKVIRCYPRQLAIAVCARLGVDVAFYTFALFILTYVTTELGMAESTALAGVLVGSALQLVLIPYFGPPLSRRSSPSRCSTASARRWRSRSTCS